MTTEVELFTLDEIQKAYEAWQAGDVPQSFPEMMRDSGWFMAGKQSRAVIAALSPQEDALRSALERIVAIEDDDTMNAEDSWTAMVKIARQALDSKTAGEPTVPDSPQS